MAGRKIVGPAFSRRGRQGLPPGIGWRRVADVYTHALLRFCAGKKNIANGSLFPLADPVWARSWKVRMRPAGLEPTTVRLEGESEVMPESLISSAFSHILPNFSPNSIADKKRHFQANNDSMRGVFP